eukprot:171994-Pelagomonas_calceolata.AAC.2
MQTNREAQASPDKEISETLRALTHTLASICTHGHTHTHTHMHKCTQSDRLKPTVGLHHLTLTLTPSTKFQVQEATSRSKNQEIADREVHFPGDPAGREPRTGKLVLGGQI